MPRYFYGASLLAILAASPLSALAQQAAAPSTVDPLVVIANRAGAPGSGCRRRPCG